MADPNAVWCANGTISSTKQEKWDGRKVYWKKLISLIFWKTTPDESVKLILFLP